MDFLHDCNGWYTTSVHAERALAVTTMVMMFKIVFNAVQGLQLLLVLEIQIFLFQQMFLPILLSVASPVSSVSVVGIPRLLMVIVSPNVLLLHNLLVILALVTGTCSRWTSRRR